MLLFLTLLWVRARLLYVLSAAYDPGRNAVYTLTVPNNRVRRLVVSRFDRRDLTLSEEYSPALAPEPGLTLVQERTLDELVITGAAVAEGKLFALSAAFGTLLTIDLATREVVAAHAIPGLTRPTSMAIRSDLYVVDVAGMVTVVARPRHKDSDGTLHFPEQRDPGCLRPLLPCRRRGGLRLPRRPDRA